MPTIVLRDANNHAQPCMESRRQRVVSHNVTAMSGCSIAIIAASGQSSPCLWVCDPQTLVCDPKSAEDRHPQNDTIPSKKMTIIQTLHQSRINLISFGGTENSSDTQFTSLLSCSADHVFLWMVMKVPNQQKHQISCNVAVDLTIQARSGLKLQSCEDFLNLESCWCNSSKLRKQHLALRHDDSIVVFQVEASQQHGRSTATENCSKEDTLTAYRQRVFQGTKNTVIQAISFVQVLDAVLILTVDENGDCVLRDLDNDERDGIVCKFSLTPSNSSPVSDSDTHKIVVLTNCLDLPILVLMGYSGTVNVMKIAKRSHQTMGKHRYCVTKVAHVDLPTLDCDNSWLNVICTACESRAAEESISIVACSRAGDMIRMNELGRGQVEPCWTQPDSLSSVQKLQGITNLPVTNYESQQDTQITTCTNCSMFQTNGSTVLGAFFSPFSDSIHVRCISAKKNTTNTTIIPKSHLANDEYWTLFPKHPPGIDSVLSAESKRQMSETTKAPSSTVGSKQSRKGLQNVHLKHHKRRLNTVRSSGYGNPTQQRNNSWGKSSSSRLQCKSNSKLQSRKSRGVRAVQAVLDCRTGAKSYPCKEGIVHAPLTFQPEHTWSEENQHPHDGAITCIRFSPLAESLASSSTDHSIRVHKLPISKYLGSGQTYLCTTDDTSHGKAVLGKTSKKERVTNRVAAAATPISLEWSHGSLGVNSGQNCLVSTYLDGHCRVWCGNSGADPLLEIPPEFGSGTDSSVSCGNNPVVSRAFTGAQFFYLDRFILASSSAGLSLYTFQIDIAKAKAWNTPSSRGRWEAGGNDKTNSQLRSCWTPPSEFGTVTSFDAANGFLSHIIIASTSNGGVALVDVATDRWVQLNNSIKSSVVRIPRASAFTAHTPRAYDVFLTSSTDNGGTVALWDLRTCKPEQMFVGHCNRATDRMGVELSPCLGFIATGSEDNSAYLFDRRMPWPLERLRGKHRAPVVDVAFNPLHPQLVTADYDGSIQFFRSRW